MLDTLLPVLELVNKLTNEQKATLIAHLQGLETCDEFNKLSPENIRQLEYTVTQCPRCLSRHIISWGKHKKRKRFMCKNCDRTFNVPITIGITGTIWNGIHNQDKFKAYIQYIIEGQSLKTCCELVGICLHTSFYWRHKILKSFESIDNQWLKQEIQVDETFLLESAKGQRYIVIKKNRKPRKRGVTASKSGVNA